MKLNKTNIIGFCIFLFISLSYSYTIYASGINKLSIGLNAPKFNLKGYSSNNPKKDVWNLDDINSYWKVLYFYPKDFTEGCTIEAKKFNNLSSKFKEVDATIIGISNDLLDDHQSFCEKEDLQLILLTDEGGNVSKKYDSWNYPYSKRNTFLVDNNGIIKYIWIGVNPARHPQEVLDKIIDLEV